MAKAVAYTLAAAAFILFVLLSHKPVKSNTHIPLGRRLGFKHPNFDPLITKLERKATGKRVTISHEIDSNDSVTLNDAISSDSDDDAEGDVYFDHNGRLNMTIRLMALFPLIDNLPKDGMVEFRELEAWNLKQATERLDYRTRRELMAHDEDGDGCISFKEYLPRFSDADIEKNNMEHGEAGWWKERFTNADADGDGLLNYEEFKSFLHPEDSSNEKIQEWLLQEKIRRMDRDNDRRLNFNEFRDVAYDIFRKYYEFQSHARGDVPSPEDEFAYLDVNKDRFLTVQELKPIRHYLSPGERDYASYFTTFLMQEADDNKDGKLTPEEMVNHEDAFYDAVYTEEDDEDDGDFHDEF
ncbi:hypothetical protein Nepgr_020189 [Nepenthes gracilis]|uniref:EF-hand domain-containing protein n=1 Tax=Nepenthes gracilis TaxID=150966 RepID=A0AAD3SUI7_NEPGR|nr:hypothetical protein Nepgr_020189 [Nepenthes gracilis]